MLFNSSLRDIIGNFSISKRSKNKRVLKNGDRTIANIKQTKNLQYGQVN